MLGVVHHALEEAFMSHSTLRSLTFIDSFTHSIHALQSADQVRPADILWQPSSLPCFGIFSTM